MQSVSIRAVIIACMLAGGDFVAGIAAASQRPEVADKQTAPSVDVELVILSNEGLRELIEARWILKGSTPNWPARL